MNWSQELLQSAIWLSEATAITLVVSLLLGVVLVRTTMWGRQFWRLAAPFFTPRISGWRPLLSLGAILLITLAGVRVNVLFSRWYNDMYSALQQLNVKLFWASMLIFGVLAAVHVGRSLLEYYLRQVFAIHWRESLNEYFLGKWLDKQGYYRSQHLAKPADNPDQRIQQDISSFVGSSLSLAMGVIDALVSTFEFTLILWGLSGVFALFGVEIPRGLVFMVYIYVIVATVLAFRIGKPLIRLNFLNEKFGADYRYALVRLREYGENIAFYRGEKVEGTTLRLRFRGDLGAQCGLQRLGRGAGGGHAVHVKQRRAAVAGVVAGAGADRDLLVAHQAAGEAGAVVAVEHRRQHLQRVGLAVVRRVAQGGHLPGHGQVGQLGGRLHHRGARAALRGLGRDPTCRQLVCGEAAVVLLGLAEHFAVVDVADPPLPPPPPMDCAWIAAALGP